MSVGENLSLVDWLRRILLEWELSPEKLSVLTHTPQDVLERFLRMNEAQISELPTVPQGLENAVPFIAIYRRLVARFPETEEQLKWLFTEHEHFSNHKPIDIIAQTNENLLWVSYYLESSR